MVHQFKRVTCVVVGIALIGWAVISCAPVSNDDADSVVLGKKAVALVQPQVDLSPAIDIEKHTNGQDADEAPGPNINMGEFVVWTYVVTNTGQVPLTNVTVTDDQGVMVMCPGDALAPGEIMSCMGNGGVVEGPYANIGTAEGTAPDGAVVSDSDPSHYTGILPPPPEATIDIEKATNGEDADDAPGPEILVGDPVAWTYEVRNTGTVALTNVTVTDDQGVTVTCPGDALEPGESMTCTAGGVAVEGQYENIGMAEGTAPDDLVVTDSDVSHYLGTLPPPPAPAIDIEKATNGEDADDAPGPEILVGDPVTWTYVVRNTGTEVLMDVTVTDDQGVLVTCPQVTLEPGESMTCTADGVAVEGQYANLGTAEGMGSEGKTASDEDPSHYIGVPIEPPAPAIDIEKATNGQDADEAPGPCIAVGDPVAWTYEVTNTGEVALTNVTVTDDQGVAVTCPGDALEPGESMTCTSEGTAVAGPYVNEGTAEGTASDGTVVSDSDLSHYNGFTRGRQGCGHGYWKNHPEAWPATGYDPDQTVESVFAEAAAYPEVGSATLMEALKFGGGPTVADAAGLLVRHGIAALLNASHPGVEYPGSPDEVIDAVNAALATGDRKAMLGRKGTLEGDNKLKCPLGNDKD